MTNESLRQALLVTLRARAALLADDLDAYTALLDEREPFLTESDDAIDDIEGFRGLAGQLRALDAECGSIIEGARQQLLGELADLRRVQLNQRQYTSSVFEPGARGSVVQLRG